MNPMIAILIIAQIMLRGPNGSGFSVLWAMIWEIAPNPGRIRMYTSGCPKNQNRCWNRIGSPPPLGSKNDVLMFRSVNSIVMAPARTGSDSSSRITVRSIAQINSGVCINCILFGRIFIIVVMKLIVLIMEDAPARWREKIARSTEGPLWAILFAKGGYIVQPVPTPVSTSIDKVSRNRDGKSIQSLRLFRRGKAISGAPSIRGSNQFPRPLISTGMTKKKIIRSACAVTIVL